MTPAVALAVLCGIGVAVGVMAIVYAVVGVPVPAMERAALVGVRLRRVSWLQIGAATVVGLVVLKLTGWVAVAAAMFALVACWQQFFGAAKAEHEAIDRLEALASWTESLRDGIATSAAMAEALPASVSAAPAALLPALYVMRAEMEKQRPISEALLKMADVLDDPSSDLIISALADNLAGRNLRGVLGILSQSARREVDIRRTIDAERRTVRRSMRIALIIIALVTGGMTVFNPAYETPYNTTQGQLVLGIVVAMFAVGAWWMRRLARFNTPPRFLARQDQASSDAGSLPARRTALAGGQR